MGDQISCCTTVENNENDEIVYEQKEQKKTKVVYKYRQGQPSEQIGININDLRSYVKSLQEWEKMQDKIFEITGQERKRRRKKIEVNRPQILKNKLPDPYYLPKQNAFYLGQWAFVDEFGDNVPYGIGKLYEKDCISEGVFETFRLKDSSSQSQIMNQIQQASEVEENKSEVSHNKIDQLMNKDSDSFTETTSKLKSISIKLNGQGMIISQDVELTGAFHEGVLHGKGTLKYVKEEYEYVGLWKEGNKHGKGKEISKQTEYEGYFKDNLRNGRGTQIFHGPMKKRHAREEDDKKFKKKMQQDGESIKNEVEQKLEERKKQQKKIKKALKDYPHPIQFEIKKSLLFDLHLAIEREHRKIFLEEYSGEFLRNHMHGKGKYTWRNGKIYDGFWKEGAMDGFGQFIWPDNSVYQGHYVNDLKHGKGIMIWNVERRYRGDWAFGLRHGYGEAIEIDEDWNIVIKGAVWNKDKIQEVKFQKVIKIQDK